MELATPDKRTNRNCLISPQYPRVLCSRRIKTNFGFAHLAGRRSLQNLFPNDIMRGVKRLGWA
jgi:hypothetical protein